MELQQKVWLLHWNLSFFWLGNKCLCIPSIVRDWPGRGKTRFKAMLPFKSRIFHYSLGSWPWASPNCQWPKPWGITFKSLSFFLLSSSPSSRSTGLCKLFWVSVISLKAFRLTWLTWLLTDSVYTDDHSVGAELLKWLLFVLSFWSRAGHESFPCFEQEILIQNRNSSQQLMGLDIFLNSIFFFEKKIFLKGCQNILLQRYQNEKFWHPRLKQQLCFKVLDYGKINEKKKMELEKKFWKDGIENLNVTLILLRILPWFLAWRFLTF